MVRKGVDIDACVGRIEFLLSTMYNLILVKTIQKFVSRLGDFFLGNASDCCD